VASALALASPGAALADPVPEDARWSERTIRSADGIRLHADVFRPEALAEDERTPVIVIVSPYLSAGSSGDLTRPTILPYYRDLFAVAFRRGYSIVQVALRGQGGSEGCPDLGGAGEQGDATAAVEWAASRAWSSGRVGMWGLSYDGLTQVMNLANHPRGLRATVIMGPSIDQHRVFFMNGVPYARGRLIAPYYHGLSLVPPALLPVAHRPPFDAGPPSDPLCLARLAELRSESARADPGTPFWRERNFISRAGRSRVPVLWSHGFFDEQTYASSFLPLWRRLEGPRRAWFGQFPHVAAGEAELGSPEILGKGGFTAEAMRWLDRHVKRGSARRAQVRRDPPLEIQEGSAGRWRAERRWPPADARYLRLPVLAGEYVDASPNKAYPGCFRVELSCPPGPSGVGSWSISQPLPYAVHLAGVPRLKLRVSAPAPAPNLVALLYDIDPHGSAAFISRGARVLGREGAYRLNLYPQDWRIEPGHRIGMLLAGADDLWFDPVHTGAPVRVERAGLRLPFLRHQRSRFLEGGPSQSVTQRTTFSARPALALGREVTVPLPPRMRRR
jgi:predicted acyl esterase